MKPLKWPTVWVERKACWGNSLCLEDGGQRAGQKARRFDDSRQSGRLRPKWAVWTNWELGALAQGSRPSEWIREVVLFLVNRNLPLEIPEEC